MFTDFFRKMRQNCRCICVSQCCTTNATYDEENDSSDTSTTTDSDQEHPIVQKLLTPTLSHHSKESQLSDASKQFEQQIKKLEKNAKKLQMSLKL
jgi:hypothetical protein